MSRRTIPAAIGGMVLAALTFALAQQQISRAPEPKQPPQLAEMPRDPRFRTIEGLAEACGPEFHADSLLRLTELASNENARWKKRAIEDSYLLGGRATVPYASVPVPVGFTDTAPAMTAISSRLQIDRLSLQLRAVRAMMALDTSRARELFDAIPIPYTSPVTCGELAVPDLSLYYDILRVVAQRCFTASEIQKGEQEQFIARRILASTSPLQVFPAAALLADIDIGKSSRRRLLALFASVVAGIHGDDRSFTVSLLRDEPASQLRALINQCQSLDLSPVAIVDAFRAFYAYHIASRRCSDTASSRPLRTRQQNALENFNKIALSYIPNRRSLTLPEDSAYDNAVQPTDLWQQSSDYKSFIARMAKLDTVQTVAVSDSARDSELQDIAQALDLWSGSDTLAPEEFFIVKSQLLSRMLRIARFSDSYRRVAEAYVHFLESSRNIRDTMPALWLYCAIGVLHSGESEGPPHLRTLDAAFAASRDPVLNLYAELQHAATERTAVPQ